MSIVPSASVFANLLTLPGASVTLAVERLTETATKGRASQSWAAVAEPGGSVTGVLSQARPADVANLTQGEQRISHVLAVPGARSAVDIQPGDFLVAGSARYWVVDVLDPSGLGLFTRLLLDERHGPVDGGA